MVVCLYSQEQMQELNASDIPCMQSKKDKQNELALVHRDTPSLHKLHIIVGTYLAQSVSTRRMFFVTCSTVWQIKLMKLLFI